MAYDPQVLAVALATAKKFGATPKETKALVEALIVESGVRNLNYGDADSLGPLQQRKSQGWKHPRNVAYAVRDFLVHARAVNSRGMSAGTLAQSVQRSAYPEKYDKVAREANRLLASRPAGRVGARATGAIDWRNVQSPGSKFSYEAVDPEATKRVALANYLAKTNPNSMLLRLGVLSPDEATTYTRTVSSPPNTMRVPFASPGLAAGATSSGRIKVTAGANRPGVPLSGLVRGYARQVSAAYGKPLTITTGSQHNQYVAGTNRQSEHWTGNAADIPASGQQLTRLGQAALIAAGMSPKRARQQRGGVYNMTVGGRRIQILFNTNTGGNHYDHLHIGVH